MNNVASEIESALWNPHDPLTRADIRPRKLEVVPDDTRKSYGSYIGIDCEYVGVRGFNGIENELARISIINYYGYVLYDVFVRPKKKVVDWRTWISGVTPANMIDAVSFEEARGRTEFMLQGKILVGHALQNDLKVLRIRYPQQYIRDTSNYAYFRQISGGRPPALKALSQRFLGVSIQNGPHCSIEDARTAMLLYRIYKRGFENSIVTQRQRNRY
ncbi:RNA exonuclease 4 [[Candida] anglica]